MNNIVTGNMDYQRRLFALTFTASVNAIPVTVVLIDDDIFEGNETFTLTIDPSSLPNDVMIAQPKEVVVLISDDNDGKLVIIYKLCSYNMTQLCHYDIMQSISLRNPISTRFDFLAHVQVPYSGLFRRTIFSSFSKFITHKNKNLQK